MQADLGLKFYSRCVGVAGGADIEGKGQLIERGEERIGSGLELLFFARKGKQFFTIEDLSRGFQTVAKMLHGRRERVPVASVSFLGARSNRLVMGDKDQTEPSFETVLRTMYDAGFRGDVYPASGMWALGNIGVFPSYPFPEGLARMRSGGF